jgi:FKBP-type peptidyl-prolyl cis-trans isomerase
MTKADHSAMKARKASSSPRTGAGWSYGRIALAVVGAVFAGTSVAADPPAVLPPGADRTNYSVGYVFGRHLADLKRHGQNVDLEMIFRGVLDGIGGVSPRVPFKDMRSTLDGLSKSGPAQQSSSPQTTKVPIRQRGYADDYAALNAKREGVIVLPSGVQYEVLKVGSGAQPKAGDTVAVNYKATLPTGVQFDSTDDSGKPADLKIAEIAVPGLKDALLHMKEGDKWRVVIPARLGFQRGQLLRKRDLIYEIELVSIVRPANPPSSQAPKASEPRAPAKQPESGQQPEG